ncbi:hypothetical protein [Brassicibacter mesophilus]|uniref:hypothetical protein n=1 Tax=Brassicibacter mesophilus TaxID=745119 RepID=UPI003D1B2814
MFREKYHHMNEQISPSPKIISDVIYSSNTERTNKKNNKSMFRRPVAILAMLMVFVFTTIPVLAAAVPTVYELMYFVSPSIAQFFMPVQKSCEDNGIKMEVVSAYIHDDTAEIYITMQDLTENRIDETTDLYDSYSIHRPFDSSATCQRVGYDDATKTVTFLITITEWGNNKIVGDKITFSVREFLSNKHEYNDVFIAVDLSSLENTPLAKNTGIIGGGGINFEKYFPDNANSIKVLVPSEPMDFPIEGIDFTGIGYVNGMLHIQTSVTNPLTNDNHGFIFLKDKSGNEIQCDYSVSFTETSDSGERVDYSEYVFDIPQAEISEYHLQGDFVTSGLFTQGNWQVTFPLSIYDNK